MPERTALVQDNRLYKDAMKKSRDRKLTIDLSNKLLTLAWNYLHARQIPLQYDQGPLGWKLYCANLPGRV